VISKGTCSDSTEALFGTTACLNSLAEQPNVIRNTLELLVQYACSEELFFSLPFSEFPFRKGEKTEERAAAEIYKNGLDINSEYHSWHKNGVELREHSASLPLDLFSSHEGHHSEAPLRCHLALRTTSTNYHCRSSAVHIPLQGWRCKRGETPSLLLHTRTSWL